MQFARVEYAFTTNFCYIESITQVTRYVVFLADFSPDVLIFALDTFRVPCHTGQRVYPIHNV